MRINEIIRSKDIAYMEPNIPEPFIPDYDEFEDYETAKSEDGSTDSPISRVADGFFSQEEEPKQISYPVSYE